MKRETMKQNNTSIKTVVFGLVLLLMGMGGAYAMSCTGTVHFQKPTTWASVYIYAGGAYGNVTPQCNATTGWCDIALGPNVPTSSQTYEKNFVFNNTGVSYPANWISRTVYDFAGQAPAATAAFTCSDFGAGTDLYIYDNPSETGKTVISTDPPNAKYLYVLIPPEKEEWMSAVPMISMDGGATGVPMSADENRCGWYYHVWFSDAPTEQVIIYRDDDPTKADAIGLNGLWDEDGVVDPIPMATYFALYGVNDLYFIPDDNLWPDEGASLGWYDVDPMVDGSCSYNLAAIIYDTDASLHPSFSCWSEGGEGCQVGAQGIPQATAVAAVNSCIGVTPGIVEDLLDPVTNKPVLKAGTGTSCFHSAAIFNQLFNETPGVNEMSCFDMPFSRSDDGRWEFDSDYFTSPGLTVQGGFYPVETTTDANIFSYSGTPTPVPAARTKRTAEGPVFIGPLLRELDPVEGVQKMDLMCNGAGWSGGYNCSTLFNDGKDLATIMGQMFPTEADPCVWGWSCENMAPNGWPKYVAKTENLAPASATEATGRWTSTATGVSGGRNQHFCFESHANFKHKPGLRFSFRGDDDIWVFIGGKLAVDLGGTHLAAPAYVNLDNITDKNGLPLVVGEEYPIDIFFCDRRTTMSNVRIKTNMYIQQKTGIKYVPTTTTNPDSSVSKEYEFCWQETGDGSCAAALGGSSGSSTECCGADIINSCKQTINITLTRRDGTIVPGGSAADLAASGVYFGGIDLTNRYSPVINMGHMQGLSPGTYKLVVTIGNKSAPIQFRISGSLDVVTRDAINPEKTSQTWKFVSSAMAGTKIPIYISSIADPGNGGNLELDIEGAAGQTYSLTTSKGLNLYADSSSDVILAASDFPRTIESSGIDTLWATVPLAAMTASTEAHTVQVAGRTSVANLTFYAPQIMFADAAGTQLNKLTDTMWVGSTYNVRLIAYNPATNTPCTDCNFSVSRGSQTSNKVETLPATIDIVNGEAVVTLRSLTEYMQTPAMLSLVGPNAALLKATLDSLYFKDPPVPFPVLAEIFDKHGVPSARTLPIPTPYFSTTQEYLDGIADSLVLHYHRAFHKDSLPDSVFVKWDLKAISGDILDSIKIDKAKIVAGTNCDQATSVCDSIIRIGGLEFSKEIQTVGSPQTIISSWSTYLDKTVPVALASQTLITDRIAPILLKGRVSNVKTSPDFDRVALLASEPVLIKDQTAATSYGLSAFTYYLKSATEVGNTPDAKYLNVIANSGDLSAARDTVVMLYNNKDNLRPSPRAGDYVRFRADMSDLISDVQGNFPTNYDADVASPWAPIEGDAKSEVLTISLGTPDPDKIKKDMEEGKVVEAIPVDIYDSKDTIQAKNPNTLGHIVKTDMGNILTAPEFIDVKAEEVTLSIKTQYFTNLGSFVAESNHNIRCDAPFFNGNYPADTSSKGDCRQNPKYVYVAWNMLSQDNRKVGTGAYIAKLSTYVNIQGRKKTAKHDQTEMWGVRRGGKVLK